MWTTTLKPVEVKLFNSPVGPTTAVPETPREVFEIFTDELMTLMVTESNRYVEDVMGSQKFAKWTKITVEEMKSFLGFSILMGINQLILAIKDYWKNDYLHYSPIADRIRDRFLEISRYISTLWIIAPSNHAALQDTTASEKFVPSSTTFQPSLRRLTIPTRKLRLMRR